MFVDKTGLNSCYSPAIAAYFRKQLDVFIVLISMTTEYFVSGGGKCKQ